MSDKKSISTNHVTKASTKTSEEDSIEQNNSPERVSGVVVSRTDRDNTINAHDRESGPKNVKIQPLAKKGSLKHLLTHGEHQSIKDSESKSEERDSRAPNRHPEETIRGGVSKISKHAKLDQVDHKSNQLRKPKRKVDELLKNKFVRQEATINHKPQSDLNNIPEDQIIKTPITVQSQNEISLSDDMLMEDTLTIGAPILVCAILAVVVCIILRFLRKLDQRKRDKRKQSKLSRAFTIATGNSKGRSPLSLISGGKVIDAEKRQLTFNNEQNDTNDIVKLQRRLDKRKLHSRRSSTISSNSSTNSRRSQLKRQVTTIAQELGRVKYRISYDFEKSVLAVSVLEAEDLPPMDLNGFCDPYVKVYLLPDKKQCEKTRVVKKSLNPKFEETFYFQESYGDLQNKTLVISVYDYDRFSKHDHIGQIPIPIDSIDLSEPEFERWAVLNQMSESDHSQLGEICLSLRYVQTAGKLNVVVMEARNLKKMDVAGLSDPYVKLALMGSDGKRMKKKKTTIKKCTLNPHYNESFSFEIPFDQIQKVQLIITMVDYDRIGTSEPIGKIVLGCQNTSGDSELRHWMDMLASPRRAIAQWHSLKDIKGDRQEGDVSSLNDN